MRSVDPNVYTKDYYLNVCLGAEEFKKSKGSVLHPRLQKLLSKILLTPNAKVLDVGCGRGDVTLYFAKKGNTAVGIDYAKDAIAIAEQMRKNCDVTIKEKLHFKQMDVKKLDFPDNYFDCVVCIDVLEHLYKEEVEIALREISRVLKKDGILFVHTGPNKVLYNFTYRWYIRPMNIFLTTIDQLVKGMRYEALPIDPRMPEEKIQHVNEPNYFYLKNLFKKHNFKGNLRIEVGFLKQIKGFRSHLYNALTTLYPLSKYLPLNILFGWVFVGELKNHK